MFLCSFSAKKRDRASASKCSSPPFIFSLSFMLHLCTSLSTDTDWICPFCVVNISWRGAARSLIVAGCRCRSSKETVVLWQPARTECRRRRTRRRRRRRDWGKTGGWGKEEKASREGKREGGMQALLYAQYKFSTTNFLDSSRGLQQSGKQEVVQFEGVICGILARILV